MDDPANHEIIKLTFQNTKLQTLQRWTVSNISSLSRAHPLKDMHIIIPPVPAHCNPIPVLLLIVLLDKDLAVDRQGCG